jgi:hypothetical protein
MKNYKDQVFDKCCKNCKYSNICDYWGSYDVLVCTKNTYMPREDKSPEYYYNMLYLWVDKHTVNENGICDYFEENI